MIKMIKQPTLVRTGHLEGYLLKDIKECLTKEEYKKFAEWAFGQTCFLYEGKQALYKHDWENFLAGGEPFD